MIIAIANQKGGVGKTTTTLNLGTYLSELGKKVLLVDMDPQANLTSGAGVQSTTGENKLVHTIYDVLINEVEPQKTFVNVPNTKATLLPAGIELAGAEVELVNAISRESVLKNALAKVEKQFDVILIDCPPSLGLLTINALVASEGVLIPVQSEYFALEGLGQLLNTINLVKAKLNPVLEITGIAITMFDGRTNLSKDVAQELADNFGKKLFQTIIPRSIRLSEAPSHGQSINIYDPKSTGAKSYRNLAKELIKRIKA